MSTLLVPLDQPLVVGEAYRLRDEIITGLNDAQEKIVIFGLRKGWEVIGYRSFAKWWSDDVAPALQREQQVLQVKLAPAIKKYVQEELNQPDPDTGRRLTPREIAPLVGQTERQVRRDLSPPKPSPPNKNQQRTLNIIPEGNQEQVWRDAVDEAGDPKRVKAKHIKDAWNEISTVIDDNWTQEEVIEAEVVEEEGYPEEEDPDDDSSEEPEDHEGWGRGFRTCEGQDYVEWALSDLTTLADFVELMADPSHNCAGSGGNCGCHGIVLTDIERDKFLRELKRITHTLEQTRDKRER